MYYFILFKILKYKVNSPKEVNSTLDKKRDVWPEKRVNDLKESKERFEERLSEIENLLEKGDKSAVEKVRRAAKRRAGLLLEENRVKRRKLGVHRPTEMDEDGGSRYVNVPWKTFMTLSCICITG